MQQKQITVGQNIRGKVIPSGMSVKDAAARLGVGRPALSNVLNGKASLSPTMALRLERAFGADSDALLELQASQDKARRRDEGKGVAVRGYVPSFLTIKAHDIERWASTNGAREGLPVLLRKLVHATGRDLARVDFPGFDNSQRPGWDGWVEAGMATAWIAEGMSGWEFGTSNNPRRKAESDYAKRTALPLDVREQCTFVFVTPRNWLGKDEWAKEKEAAGDGWKAVRAYDASDLEQWLDESVAVPVWLAEELPMPIEGVKTLEACWKDWAQASTPAMTKRIFESSVAACVKPFKAWLERPPQRPFVVAADSTDEALAFVACLYEHDEIPVAQRDLVALFTSPETLTKLATSSSPFIAIAGNDETQGRLATLYQRVHCIATCPRNAVHTTPDVALDLLGYSAFQEALTDMGLGRHEIQQLARESGRSPTILRRRLSPFPHIKTPRWASDTTLARSLIPMCLVGAWHAHKSADKEVLRALADCEEYEEVERHVADLQQIEDCPVWSVGQHRGVTSKVDVLFAVAPSMTEQNINDFFTLAEYVLSESDPALELPEAVRWAVAFHGKIRDHSEALRNGICETLVLLSMHGCGLFRARLCIDIAALVSNLVEQLLTPLGDTLLSQERDLPAYAEAAPDRFLEILEKDMRRDEPTLLGSLKPVSGQPLARGPRAGLQRALECVAWNPCFLSRTSVLLAKLSIVEMYCGWLGWFSWPMRILASILGSWTPQTAAPVAERIEVLRMLAKCFPDIGWQLCLNEVNGPRSVSDNYRPRWRGDAAGAGGAISEQDVYTSMQCAARVLLSWPDHNQITLGDLVEQIVALPEDQQTAVWVLVDDWARSQDDEEAKAELRERICTFALAKMRGRVLLTTNDRAHRACESLRPRTLTVRHAWLFTNYWIRELTDEVEDHDDQAREAKIDGLRQAAIREIWRTHGVAGALTMVVNGSDGDTVGRYVALCATDPAGVLKECLSSAADAAEVDAFMRAFINAHTDSADPELLLDVSQKIDREQSVRLWRCAPFRAKTWRVMDRLPAEVQDRYWRTVLPDGRGHAEVECTEIVDRLLVAKRPHAAFAAMMCQWANVETGCLRRLLTALAHGDTAPENTYHINPWNMSDALDALEARPGVLSHEMAQLEFAFIRALLREGHGIRNLERLIARSPDMFVEALSHCFERTDGGQDPTEWQIKDAAGRKQVVDNAHALLRRVALIPGTDDDGKVQLGPLLHWLKETRELCTKVGRSKVGDNKIGELLSKAPADEDDVWPCRAVCEALEKMDSEEVGKGFTNAKLNYPGAAIRRVNADNMRMLSAQYQRWARRLRVDYPFASRVIGDIAAAHDSYAEQADVKAALRKRLDTL